MNGLSKAVGIAFAAAGLIYLATETLAAAAWRTPRYSYARNYISDLGVTGCGELFHGRLICSPLHALMNTGFMLEGIFFLVASVLAARLIAAPWRYGILLLGAIHGVGMLLVGRYNGSQAALVDGTLRFHLLGAQMAIVAGNLALILYGGAAKRIPLPRTLSFSSIFLGGGGLLGAITLVAQLTSIPDGLLERSSVYSIMLWEIIVGVSMLLRRPPDA